MTLRRTLAVAYLTAVAASAVYQIVRPGLPAMRPSDRAAMVPVQTASGPVAGEPVRLVYDDLGTGPAVVLLHGSPGAVADFRHLRPHLTDRFRVLVPDLPGFGRSDRWLPDYSIAAHARYVLAWLDQLGIDNFQVVGFSQGGGVALHLANLAPDRIRSVSLVGGIGIQDGEGSGSFHLEHAKYAAMVPTVVAGPELIPHFGMLGSRSFRWTFFRNFWDSDQRPLRGILEQLRPPLLILHGRHDPLVPAWTAVEHHRLVSGSDLYLFDDSHFMLFDAVKTGRLAVPLVDFLGTHAEGDEGAEGVRRANVDRTLIADAGNLPDRTLWPAVQQVTVPCVIGILLPYGGCVGAGLLTGTDRADWFVAWLGALARGSIRRWFEGNRRMMRWLVLSFAIVIGVSAVAAVVCGFGAAVIVGILAAAWWRWLKRRRGNLVPSADGQGGEAA